MDRTTQLIEDLADRAIGRTEGLVVIAEPIRSHHLRTHVLALLDNAAVDVLPEPAGRLRFLKKVTLKLSTFFLVRQRAFNGATIGAVDELLKSIDRVALEIEHERRRNAAALAAADARAAVVAQQSIDSMRTVLTTRLDAEARTSADARAEATERHDQLAGLVAEQRARVADLEAELVLERNRRQVLERQVALLSASGATVAAPAEGDEAVSSLSSYDVAALYGRFEDAFRPAGDDLLERFVPYVDDLRHLAGGSAPVLDIGAARGELLQLLAAEGVPCYGIDLNAAVVADAVARGLDVRVEDAFEHLRGLAAESLGAVTAFHVVEHLEPEALLVLVDEILRVLRPGGTIVFETPNPTNVVVGASSFYHDPTHRRPVTPDYLAFVLHDRGFADVQTRFLHPLPEFELDLPPLPGPGLRSVELLLADVRWALKGPQDYAVVAHRPRGGR